MAPFSQLFLFGVFVIACVLMCRIYFSARKHAAHARGAMLEVPMWGGGLVVSLCVPVLISHYFLSGL